MANLCTNLNFYFSPYREGRKEIRDIKLEIEEVYKDVDIKVETACAASGDYQSSLKIGDKLGNISTSFWQVKCTETWAEFRCEKLARQMSVYEYENKYSCPSCQERICRQEFKRHYGEFISYGKCKRFDKNGNILN